MGSGVITTIISLALLTYSTFYLQNPWNYLLICIYEFTDSVPHVAYKDNVWEPATDCSAGCASDILLASNPTMCILVECSWQADSLCTLQFLVKFFPSKSFRSCCERSLDVMCLLALIPNLCSHIKHPGMILFVSKFHIEIYTLQSVFMCDIRVKKKATFWNTFQGVMRSNKKLSIQS
jgi:hypothetical protein